MLFSQSKPELATNANERTNEDVFAAYYSRLLRWATQITRNDRSEAEDLVHDFYLRLHRITRSLDEVEDLEPYLFKILRNLYYSRLRRAGRDPLNDLSIVDYDSLEQGLATADRRNLFLVRDDLRTVCRYAYERRTAVRSASVLILRFFHGYYPTEIMKILQSSRSSIDLLLHTARNEAHLYLQRPDAIRCISSSGKNALVFSRKGESAQQLFLELQEAIFRAPEGTCFDPAELKQRYGEEGEPKGLTTEELSHLVSCRICIERVNVLLDLPPLAERSPEDGISRNGRDGGTGPTQIPKRPAKKSPSIPNAKRRVREVFEHRPRTLQVVVDGEVRSSQNINAVINELRLKLCRGEEPGFIEILSEQGYCLMFLQVTEAQSVDAIEQVERASFSEDRSLTVTLRFGPEGAVVHVIYRDPVMADADSALLISEYRHWHAPETPADLRRKIQGLTAVLTDRLRSMCAVGWNPLLIGAGFAAAAFAVCLWLWPRHQNVSPTPVALLEHAEAAENRFLSNAEPKIVYQKLSIQSRRRTLKREIYRDSSGHKKPKQETLDPQTAELKNELSGAGVDWNEPLAALSYKDWHDRSRVLQDTVQETGDNLLTLTTKVSNADVTQESLTVRKSDFHPIARSISFRDAEVVEIAELDYAVLGWDPGFNPLFESAVPSTSVKAAIPPHLPSAEQLELAELEIRQKLHESGADLGEDIHITHSSRNVVVSGMVSNSGVALSLRASLARVPHVAVAISSPEELSVRRAAAVTETQPTEGRPELVGPLLEQQLVRSIPNEAARTRFIDHLLAEADYCRWHARALNVLLQRYPTLEDPKVKQIAKDHLQALSKSVATIATWTDTLASPVSEPQPDVVQSSQLARGNELTDESHKLEHNLAELLTDHPADESSYRNTSVVVASCQRNVKTMQRLITELP